MNAIIKSGVCPVTQKPLYASFFTASVDEIKSFDPLHNLIKVQGKTTEDEEGSRGIVAGYMSVFDNIDNGGDIIRKGAFRKTLSERRPVLLWQHVQSMPIGQVKEAYEDDYGLYAVISINLKTDLGREAYELIKAGDIGGFSIGYRAEKFDIVTKGETRYGREIKEVKLFEVSVVSLPMNDLAVVTEIKKNVDAILSGASEEIIEEVKQAETADEIIEALKSLKAEQEKPFLDALEGIKEFMAETKSDDDDDMLELLKALNAELYSK